MHDLSDCKNILFIYGDTYVVIHRKRQYDGCGINGSHCIPFILYIILLRRSKESNIRQ